MSFGPRTDGKKFSGLSFNPIVKEYVLKDKIVKTGKGEDDFIVEKVPVKADEYNLREVIQARSEGCELKSIIKRLQAGEILPEGRSPQYVDVSGTPQTLEEALEIKKKTESIIDSVNLKNLSKDQMAELGKLTKMTPGQVKAFVDNLVKSNFETSKALNVDKVVEKKEVPEVPGKVEK